MGNKTINLLITDDDVDTVQSHRQVLVMVKFCNAYMYNVISSR